MNMIVKNSNDILYLKIYNYSKSSNNQYVYESYINTTMTNNYNGTYSTIFTVPSSGKLFLSNSLGQIYVHLYKLTEGKNYQYVRKYKASTNTTAYTEIWIIRKYNNYGC